MAHHKVPSGWLSRPQSFESSPQASSLAILCRQSDIGLYDGDTDLRHFGEGELILTPAFLAISFKNVQPDPAAAATGASSSASSSSSSYSKVLHLELPLGSIQMVKQISGFAMFSSPKIQVLLLNPNLNVQKISFRKGGIDFFFKQLEQALKKKAWLSLNVSSSSSSSSSCAVSRAVAPAPAASVGAAAAATTGHNPSSQPQQKKPTSPAAGTETAFSTTHAGIAGLEHMQNQRADALKQSIHGATTQVDELIIKGQELSELMSRFRQEVAKGNYKLIDEQVEQLKRLDSRFAAEQHRDDAANLFPQQHHNQHHNQLASRPKNNTPSVEELATDLVCFLRSDAVLYRAVRVPLVELLSAYNTHRGFSFEVAPALFHAGLCELVRNFPERRFSLRDDDPAGCETVPSFSLRTDHLIQCHVLASVVLVLEKILGPRPEASTVFGHSAASAAEGGPAKSITAMQLSRIMCIALDEAQILLLLLEVQEGVLARDEHGHMLSFYWNAFCFF